MCTEIFHQYLPIHCDYNMHRCLELKIWWFSYQRRRQGWQQRQQTYKLITLPLAHACGIKSIESRIVGIINNKLYPYCFSSNGNSTKRSRDAIILCTLLYYYLCFLYCHPVCMYRSNQIPQGLLIITQKLTCILLSYSEPGCHFKALYNFCRSCWTICSKGRSWSGSYNTMIT